MEFFDTRILKSISTSVVIDNGEIREISNNFTNGAAVRALSGGTWGFVSLENPEKLDEALISARRLATAARNKCSRDEIILAPIEKPDMMNLPQVKEDPGDIPIEDKVKLLSEIEKTARIEGIKSTSAVYSESLVTVSYSNSEGIDSEYTLNRVGFAISAVAQSEGNYQIGRESRFGVMGFELFKKYDAFELARKAARTAV